MRKNLNFYEIQSWKSSNIYTQAKQGDVLILFLKKGKETEAKTTKSTFSFIISQYFIVPQISTLDNFERL